MKERPILFSTDMVRAILEGRKTQTRRIKFKCEQGDLLWVREKFNSDTSGYVYCTSQPAELAMFGKWKPSIHMPRDAARLFLRVEKTWQERLQDISDSDAYAEGVDWLAIENKIPGITISQQAFRNLWNNLYHKRGYGWDTNPTVTVIQFKVEEA